MKNIIITCIVAVTAVTSAVTLCSIKANATDIDNLVQNNAEALSSGTSGLTFCLCIGNRRDCSCFENEKGRKIRGSIGGSGNQDVNLGPGTVTVDDDPEIDKP